MSADDHAFQGIITKLRTTRGSQYALDVMTEAANRIEADAEKIAALQAADDKALQHEARLMTERDALHARFAVLTEAIVETLARMDSDWRAEGYARGIRAALDGARSEDGK